MGGYMLLVMYQCLKNKIEKLKKIVIKYGKDSTNYFVQDGFGSWSGLYVYKGGYNINIGDSIATCANSAGVDNCS